MHPATVLYQEAHRPISLPVCDHYCGRLDLLAKSLAMQARLGPVLDVTADCEDGARVGDEIDHVTQVAAALASPANRFGRLGVRPHPVAHPLFARQVAILLAPGGRPPAFLTLPKVNTLAEVETAAACVEHHEQRAGIGQPVPFQVLIESPAALPQLHAIAAHPRVEALCFGLMDYVSSFEGAVGADAMHGERQFEHPLLARALVDIAVAAQAHGKVASHSVTLAIGDGEAAGRDARRAARDFGYRRKWSIHPRQVEPIIAAFRPSHDEVQTAGEILLAARAADWGPIRHRDQLHDRASYRYWWQVLVRARLTGAPVDEAVRRAFADENAALTP
ncbi:MAG: aldolase/citrate lyase family protein [Lautropia sp.]|nr:aldolase/citrate lyase family protein [Lautropia sp.]